ncbi:MAG: GNAT family N-acetyltransferase [Alistipes sp.]|nr:GNAT family N-acetyltransferase [Alistipes sp.]
MIYEATAYTPELLDRLQALLDQLTPAPILFTEEMLRAVIDDPSSHLYLYLHEEQVVGMTTLGIYYSPTGSKGWIEDVVVDDRVRGLGYGKALVEHVLTEAHRLGVRQLMLTSNPLRVAANRLYQAMGFEKRETNCYKMDIGL